MVLLFITYYISTVYFNSRGNISFPWLFTDVEFDAFYSPISVFFFFKNKFTISAVGKT